MKIVDGGYISWIFGSDFSRTEMWNKSAITSFSKYLRVLIMMEGGNLARTKFYPDYKLQRREAVKKNPAHLARRIRVQHFIKTLEEDKRVTTVRMAGLEADDLIASYAVWEWQTATSPRSEPTTVIGIDKDYLQMGDLIYLQKTDGSHVGFHGWKSKMQKTIQPVLTEPWQVLLCLVLLGDASDNVLRLIPPYKLNYLLRILRDKNPWQTAYSIYEDAFLINLYLTILPGAWCFETVPTPLETFHIIKDGGLWAWYDQSLRQDVLALFN